MYEDSSPEKNRPDRYIATSAYQSNADLVLAKEDIVKDLERANPR